MLRPGPALMTADVIHPSPEPREEPRGKQVLGSPSGKGINIHFLAPHKPERGVSPRLKRARRDCQPRALAKVRKEPASAEGKAPSFQNRKRRRVGGLLFVCFARRFSPPATNTRNFRLPRSGRPTASCAPAPGAGAPGHAPEMKKGGNKKRGKRPTAASHQPGPPRKPSPKFAGEARRPGGIWGGPGGDLTSSPARALPKQIKGRCLERLQLFTGDAGGGINN